MQSYVLILLGILVVLLIGIIYFGWRKLITLEIENSRNKYDIEALRGLLSKILSEGGEEVNEQLQAAQALEAMQQQRFVQQSGHQDNVYNVPVQETIAREFNVLNEKTETDVQTLESTEIPELESTVTIENIESTEDNSEEEEVENTGEEDEEEEAIRLMKEELGDDDTEEETVALEKEEGDEEAKQLIEEELEKEEDSVVVAQEDDDKENGDEPEVDEKANDLDAYNRRLEEMLAKQSGTKRRRQPSESAKNYKVGFRKESAFDGNEYEVVMNGKSKKWVLVSEHLEK